MVWKAHSPVRSVTPFPGPSRPARSTSCHTTLPANGAFQFVDPASATNQMRFYRLEQLATAPGAVVQLALNTANQAVLAGWAPAGYMYAVQATKDFQSWTNIGSLITPANGAFRFTDPASATNKMRFYRLQQLATVPGAVFQLALNTANQAVLSGLAPAGYMYAVQATKDFQSWTNIGSLITPANGAFRFTDPASATNKMRFYRLQQLATVPGAVLELAVNTAKQPVLSGAGPVGYRYAVLASRDRQTWTSNGSVTVGSNGLFQFTDPARTTNSIRFYRLRQTAP